MHLRCNFVNILSVTVIAYKLISALKGFLIQKKVILDAGQTINGSTMNVKREREKKGKDYSRLWYLDLFQIYENNLKLQQIAAK